MNIDDLVGTEEENFVENETQNTQGAESAKNTESTDVDNSLKVLAVDDTAFFLRQLQSYFNDTPYKVICVNSGKSALQYLSANSVPDLFILDIDMPTMDGYTLAKNIRGKGIEKPIIFLTSHKDKASVIKAIEAGGVDFIIKPCRKEDVISRVSKHLSPSTPDSNIDFESDSSSEGDEQG